MISANPETRVREIIAIVQPLAAEYYRISGKPLGVTGEVAEYVAAEILGLTLVPARTTGYDALRGSERIQIKGRAYPRVHHRHIDGKQVIEEQSRGQDCLCFL